MGVKSWYAVPKQEFSVKEKFAEVLKLHRLQDTDAIHDEFDILREFRSVVAQKAAHAFEAHDEAYRNWELELKLWDLVETLLVYRYAEKPAQIETHRFNSDVVFQEKHFRGNPQLYELWLVTQWIQRNAQDVGKPKLQHKKWFNSMVECSLDSFDTDAPLRGQKLSPRDIEAEVPFYKMIFELILAGDYTQAAKECEITGNWTLKMILSGVNSYLDPVIDKGLTDTEDESTHGIKRRALWRSTVYRLSQSEQLTPYERAIYAFLAGDLKPLELSDSWDSDLLIYANHILTAQVERALVEEGKVNTEDLIVLFPSTRLTVQDVLNTVANKYKDESEHPLRVLMASVITKNIPQIIHSSLGFVGNVMLGKEESNELISETYALRVVTHLAIFLTVIDPGMIPVEDRSKLITTYILVLRLEEKYGLIPLYVSFLPEVEARNAYSLFLMDLFDSLQRSKQLELSRVYRLPLENILKRTVERVFTSTEEHYRVSGGVTVQDIDDTDMKLMRGVEWFVESRMYSDAIHSSIALYRRFLLNGRTKAAQEFGTRNSIEQLLKQYDVESMGMLVDKEVSQLERNELLQYASLTRALNAIDEWSTRPTAKYSFLDTINRVSSILKHSIETLFLELSRTEYEPSLIQELRSLYIPFLIIQLHNIYLEGRTQSTSYLREALELTNIVASESTKFYILFQNCDRLKEYLAMVAHCAAIAAGEGI